MLRWLARHLSRTVSLAMLCMQDMCANISINYGDHAKHVFFRHNFCKLISVDILIILFMEFEGILKAVKAFLLSTCMPSFCLLCIRLSQSQKVNLIKGFSIPSIQIETSVQGCLRTVMRSRTLLMCFPRSQSIMWKQDMVQSSPSSPSDKPVDLSSLIGMV